MADSVSSQHRFSSPCVLNTAMPPAHLCRKNRWWRSYIRQRWRAILPSAADSQNCFWVLQELSAGGIPHAGFQRAAWAPGLLIVLRCPARAISEWRGAWSESICCSWQFVFWWGQRNCRTARTFQRCNLLRDLCNEQAVFAKNLRMAQNRVKRFQLSDGWNLSIM